MTSLESVADRVELWMRENPGQHGFREIARGVKVADELVREALQDDERFWRRERGAYDADRAVVYFLPPTAADGSRRARKRTQAQNVEAVLADGRWHTAEEIHKRCGFMRLNSRIAELRKKRGLNIECERIAGVPNGAGAYQYRLIPTATLETSEEAAPGARSLPEVGSAASSDASCPRDSEETSGASDDQQLSLPEAA